MFAKFCKLLADDLETVPFEPRNLVVYTVNLSIVLRTSEGVGVFLDSVDSPPPVGQGECNDVATNACKAINQDSSLCRSRF